MQSWAASPYFWATPDMQHALRDEEGKIIIPYVKSLNPFVRFCKKVRASNYPEDKTQSEWSWDVLFSPQLFCKYRTLFCIIQSRHIYFSNDVHTFQKSTLKYTYISLPKFTKYFRTMLITLRNLKTETSGNFYQKQNAYSFFCHCLNVVHVIFSFLISFILSTPNGTFSSSLLTWYIHFHGLQILLSYSSIFKVCLKTKE